MGWIGALALVAIAVIALRQGGSSSGPSPSTLPPSTATMTTVSPTVAPTALASSTPPATVAPLALFTARIVTWAHNVLAVRPLDQPGREVAIGTLEPNMPPRLMSEGRWVVAEGTELSGDHRRGVFVVDATGHTPMHFIGPGRAAISPSTHQLWLVDGGEAQSFGFDGTRIGDVYSITGSLVGATGAYLIVNENGHATARTVQGDSGFSAPGPAISVNGEMVMWKSARGTTFTDPNNEWSRTIALSAEIGLLSDNGQEFVVSQGAHVSFGVVTTTQHETTLRNPVVALASSPTRLAIAIGSDGSLTYLDPSTGASTAGVAVPTDTVAVTVIPETEWAYPVIASEGAWEVRAYAEEDKEFDAVYFATTGPYQPLDIHAAEPMNALRLPDGSIVGVVNDPAIVAVGTPTRTVAPVDYGFGTRVFAFPPGPGPVTITGFDSKGHGTVQLRA